MRYLGWVLALWASAAGAETFELDAKISAVTLYPNSGLITREAPLSMGPGRHILIIDDLPKDVSGSLQLTLPDGVTELSRQIEFSVLSARENFERALGSKLEPYTNLQNRLQDLNAEIAKKALLREAFDAQKKAFERILGADPDAALSSDDLAALAGSIAAVTLQSGSDAIDAEQEIERLEFERELLVSELGAFEDSLGWSGYPSLNRTRLVVTVDVAQNTEAALFVQYLHSEFGLSWRPAYAFNLDLGEAAQLTVQRGALITLGTTGDWRDVQLTLSTIEPTGQLMAQTPRPQLKMIRSDTPIRQTTSRVGSADSAYADEPTVEAPVIIEQTNAGVSFIPGEMASDLGVSYTLPEPISATAADGPVELSLGSQMLDVTLRAVATPGLAEMAFLQAFVTNSTQTPLPAAVRALRFVDGVFVGDGPVPDLRPGAEVQLGFGPLQAVSVRKVTTRRQSGDRGIVSRQNQQTEEMVIEVENHSPRSWDLRILDSVPYSEQEDLGISWTANPRPTVIDLDDQRGLLAWDGNIDPGQARKINLTTDITWPDGMVLR